MFFFRLSLSIQMLIATLLGIFAGIFLGDLCEAFSPFASAYIMILKITAVPYLIVAIIHGVGQLSSSQSMQMLKKGILFICGAWILNVTMIYTIVFLFPSAKGTRITSYNPGEGASLNFAELLIPDNIFYALSNNIVPAIVIFCLLLGIALIHRTDKGGLIRGLDSILGLLTHITHWISRITPIGTFLIIAKQFGTVNLVTIKQVSTYIILYILIIGLIVFWICPRIISTFTNITARKWLKELAPVLLLAYTTNFVIVCLPYIIEILQRQLSNNLGYEDQKAQDEVQGIVSVVFNLPLGSLFISVFVIFLTIFYSVPLNLATNVQLLVTTFLTSLGAVGLGSWINTLSFVLDSLLLPQDAINLYLTTLPFTSGFQSMLSVMEISGLAFLVSLACRRQIKSKLPQVIRGGLFSLGPVFLLAACIKITNPLPPIQSSSKNIYDLGIDASMKVQVHTQAPSPSPSNLSTLERIAKTGVLRVGYVANAAPFGFLNSQNELAGFDIAFAYELAYDLGCNLEFIPLSYANVTDQVNANVFDIAMGAVSMNESRIQKAYFTQPYMETQIVLVLSEENRKKFRNAATIMTNPKIRIGALKGTSYAEIAALLFPHNPLVLFDQYDEFVKQNLADVLIWSDVEAIAWIIKNPRFRIILPSPPIGKDTFAYTLRQGDDQFLEFMNNWLTLKKTEGYYEHQYELWIKGKTEKVAITPPRWSIIRDVLHWVD